MIFDVTINSAGEETEFVGQVRTGDAEYAAAMVMAGLNLFKAAPTEQKIALVFDALARRAAVASVAVELRKAKEERLERS